MERQIHFVIEKNLVKRLKIQAAKEDTSLKAILIRALEKYLKEAK